MYNIYFFFFNDTATTEIYTLSLHDALPICEEIELAASGEPARAPEVPEIDLREPADRATEHRQDDGDADSERRSEEHTSELQSRQYLVCRLLLEKKNNNCCTQSISLINNLQ